MSHVSILRRWEDSGLVPFGKRCGCRIRADQEGARGKWGKGGCWGKKKQIKG